MLLALMLAAAPLPALRAATTDGAIAWLLTENEQVIRRELISSLETRHALPSGRRVDEHHVEQIERLTVDAKRHQVLVVSQSRNAGPLQGSVAVIDATTLEPLSPRWTFAVASVVRGEARVLAEPRLLVVRVDEASDVSALFAALLPEGGGEVKLHRVCALNGPMNGGSRFEVARSGKRIMVATTGSGAQLVALTLAGALDTTFADGGIARAPEVTSVGGLVASNDGWVLIGSGTGASAIGVRFDSAGRVDRSWAEEGRLRLRLRDGWLESGVGVVSLGGGTLAVVVSSYETTEAVQRATLVQLDARGHRVSTTELTPPTPAQRVLVIDVFRATEAIWVALNAGVSAFNGQGVLLRK